MNTLVRIYADESCLGNQFTEQASPGGAAGLLACWREDGWTRRDYWLSEPATTNNRMALCSAIAALAYLQRPCRVIFVSDSKYLIQGNKEWLAAWIRRGWRRKTGPIENEDLWRELVEARRRHAIEWQWVRGHAGHPQNEYANFLATRAARDQTTSGGLVASGFPGWLEQEREKRERYFDFNEWAPPADTDFHPSPPLPEG